jgi:hypothetical protein
LIRKTAMIGYCALVVALPGGSVQSSPTAELQSVSVTSTTYPPTQAVVTGRAAAKIEDITRELGPFQLQNQRFTVILHKKHLAGLTVTDPEFQTTLVGIEIKDASGSVHYRDTFGYEVSGNEFSDTLSAEVELLQGKERSGLLVTYGSLPSTPLGGQSWQVFGLFDNKLIPFSKPIHAEGELANPAVGTPEQAVVKTMPEPRLQGEVLNFRLWTGNFFVIYPVRVDFLMAKTMPAWRCFEMGAQGMQSGGCEFRVEAECQRLGEDLTFVRLHAEATEGMGTPGHVVLKKDSKVVILAAQGKVDWQEDDHGVGLTPGDDFWLKVRIDGKEGWIHTQEDFLAIGLPQSG